MGSVYRCENPRSLGRRECQLIAAEDDYYRAPLSKKDILALGKELIHLVEDERAMSSLEETSYGE